MTDRDDEQKQTDREGYVNKRQKDAPPAPIDSKINQEQEQDDDGADDKD